MSRLADLERELHALGAEIAFPSTPDLAASSDTGISTTDDLTNDTTPSFSGSAETGATVVLKDGSTEVGSGVATGGTWTITTSALGPGAHPITAQATDVAGNQASSAGGLTITIDTAPPGVPSVPDLTPESDDGAS